MNLNSDRGQMVHESPRRVQTPTPTFQIPQANMKGRRVHQRMNTERTKLRAISGYDCLMVSFPAALPLDPLDPADVPLAPVALDVTEPVEVPVVEVVVMRVVGAVLVGSVLIGLTGVVGSVRVLGFPVIVDPVMGIGSEIVVDGSEPPDAVLVPAATETLLPVLLLVLVLFPEWVGLLMVNLGLAFPESPKTRGDVLRIKHPGVQDM